MGVLNATNNKVLNRITAWYWLLTRLTLSNNPMQNRKEHSSEAPSELCEVHFVNIWVLKSSFFISLCGVAQLGKDDFFKQKFVEEIGKMVNYRL